jgi:hypothetical protein
MAAGIFFFWLWQEMTVNPSLFVVNNKGNVPEVHLHFIHRLLILNAFGAAWARFIHSSIDRQQLRIRIETPKIRPQKQPSPRMDTFCLPKNVVTWECKLGIMLACCICVPM